MITYPCSNGKSNSPVSQLFSPSGEQLEQRILAYKQNNQVLICYIKYGVSITNFTLWNPGRYITDMSKCYRVGVWRMD